MGFARVRAPLLENRTHPPTTPYHAHALPMARRVPRCVVPRPCRPTRPPQETTYPPASCAIFNRLHGIAAARARAAGDFHIGPVESARGLRRGTTQGDTATVGRQRVPPMRTQHRALCAPRC